MLLIFHYGKTEEFLKGRKADDAKDAVDYTVRPGKLTMKNIRSNQRPLMKNNTTQNSNVSSSQAKPTTTYCIKYHIVVSKIEKMN